MAENGSDSKPEPKTPPPPRVDPAIVSIQVKGSQPSLTKETRKS